ASAVSVTPYGQDGPLARVPGSDLEVTAASGSLWLAGEEGRPPVRTAQPQSPYWSGMYGALGALVAMQSPVAQRVDVSAQAAMTTVHPPAPVWWDIAREEHARTGPFLLGRSNVGSRFRNLWACADGFVSFAIQGGPIGRHTGRMLARSCAPAISGATPRRREVCHRSRFPAGSRCSTENGRRCAAPRRASASTTRRSTARWASERASSRGSARRVSYDRDRDPTRRAGPSRSARRYPRRGGRLRGGGTARRKVPREFRRRGHPSREPTCRRRVPHDVPAI